MRDFDSLQHLIAEYTSSGKNPFYRDLYDVPDSEHSLHIKDWSAWRSLPFLTKDALARVPLKQRLFSDVSNVDHIRSSGGTSGKPPVFSPRMNTTDMDHRALYHSFEGGCLALTPVGSPLWHEQWQASLGHTPRVVVFDPRNIRASLIFARAARVTFISLFIHHVMLLAEPMRQDGIANLIRCIELNGESCSKATFMYLREVFPNATFISTYGLSEMSLPVFPCRPIRDEVPRDVYHSNDISFLELIDFSGRHLEPTPGTEGELVVTICNRGQSVFPVFRYRTGDIVRVVGEPCEHRTWGFTVLGRKDADFIRIPGGMLRLDETRRVLGTLKMHVTDRFELHCSERATADGLKIETLLHIDSIKGVKINLAHIADMISQSLRVGPTMTYADGVARGLYFPLVCEKFEGVRDPLRKTQCLFFHSA